VELVDTGDKFSVLKKMCPPWE